MMKTLRLCLLGSFLFGSACSKNEDATPSYSNFTPVGGTLAVSKNGAASYNLTDLKLKITKNVQPGKDAYDYRGTYNGLDGVEVLFFLNSTRTGNGPFTTTSTAAYYVGGFAGSQTLFDSCPTATFYTTNPNSGTFCGSKISGSLK